jgi:hypothetical protein
LARKLTPQQRAFAVEVASGCTATEAAIRAGYSRKTAGDQASQLLRNPKIASEVERIQGKATVASLGSKAEALDLIWRTMNEAAQDGDRVNVYRGSELWLKATGQLVEKREVKQQDVVELEWSAPIEPEADDEG